MFNFVFGVCGLYCILGLVFILPTYPSPLRNLANDFQINYLKVNEQQIKTILDIKCYDFFGRNLVIVCRKQEFPSH